MEKKNAIEKAYKMAAGSIRTKAKEFISAALKTMGEPTNLLDEFLLSKEFDHIASFAMIYFLEREKDPRQQKLVKQMKQDLLQALKEEWGDD